MERIRIADGAALRLSALLAPAITVLDASRVEDALLFASTRFRSLMVRVGDYGKWIREQ